MAPCAWQTHSHNGAPAFFARKRRVAEESQHSHPVYWTRIYRACVRARRRRPPGHCTHTSIYPPPPIFNREPVNSFYLLPRRHSTRRCPLPKTTNTGPASMELSRREGVESRRTNINMTWGLCKTAYHVPERSDRPTCVASPILATDGGLYADGSLLRVGWALSLGLNAV